MVAANPSEKYDFVSWDSDIPNIWKNKSHVPNHRSVIHRYIYIYITVIIKPSTTITNLVGISISIVGATMTILILMISVV